MSRPRVPAIAGEPLGQDSQDNAPATKATQTLGKLRAILLVVSAFAPVIVAALVTGRVHPDEIFQWLEPAHHVAGYPATLSWEWKDAFPVRNWVGPGFLGSFLIAAKKLGIVHPLLRRLVLALPLGCMHAAAVWCTARYARARLDADARGRDAHAWWPFLAALLASTPFAILLYAGRTLSEALSADLLVIGYALLDKKTLRSQKFVPLVAAFGGLALGFSVVVRYGSIPLAGIPFLPLLFLRDTKGGKLTLLPFVGATAGFLVAIAVLGVVDYTTWKGLFPSFVNYLDYNVLSGKAEAAFGASPPSFYAEHTLSAVPLWVPFAALAATVSAVGLGPSERSEGDGRGETQGVARDSARTKWARPFANASKNTGNGVARDGGPETKGARLAELAPAPAVVGAAIYLGLLLRTPHKEARFVFPALVLLTFAAAPALIALLRRFANPDAPKRKGLQIAAYSALVLAFASNIPATGLEEFPLRSAEFRAYARASALPGTNGVSLCDEGFWGTPGNAYLAAGHIGPGCGSDDAASADRLADDGSVNRVIVHRGPAHRELIRRGFRDAFFIGPVTAVVR